MNKEIYVSWCKRLSESQEAMKLLKESAFVTGIETCNYGDDEKKFQEVGLKVSIHNPNRFLKLDLTDEHLVDILTSKEHGAMLEVMKKENAHVVGFHTCHKIFFLHKKMVLKADEDEVSIISHDDEVLMNNIINNLLRLENLINKGLDNDNKKKILFETSPFYDPKVVEKRDFSSEREKIIVKLVSYFTSPDFIRKVLEHPEIKANGNFGFLFDVSHVFITANTKVLSKKFKGKEEDYIKEIIDAAKGKIYQVHINVPNGSIEKGLVDAHNPLTLGGLKSEKVLSFVREVLKHNPGLTTITLEMQAGNDPISHAKVLVEQAELIAKELKL